MKTILSVIVPCFNEDEVIESSSAKLISIISDLITKRDIDCGSSIIFIDDGSKDRTWRIIKKIQEKNKKIIRAIRLSRNYGHQNALMAGMFYAKSFSDCVISIDADLQQDYRKIPDFIDQFKKGNEIVLGIRNNRKCDNFLKKTSAIFFYDLMRMMGTEIVKNHADYRLLSKRAIDNIFKYKEKNLFLRGIISEIGLQTSVVNFEVKERRAGKSKYGLRKMISFALNGITSFSVMPLRAVSLFGIIIFVISLIMTIYVLVEAIILKNVLPGWSSTVLPIYFIGGVQILCLGVIGEYIGKIYMETKDRPRYIISETLE